jgi:hypothetical protein
LKEWIALTTANVRAEVIALRSTMLPALECRVTAQATLIEHRLLTRLGGLVVVMPGIILGALRYLPPGLGG